ncbi:uncharacterized protein F5147DRAFT_662795 [Suillus discolor]|uniref:Uncharacterized protein n=1 Tax=Suillus discolor TaxID=1912936 RepID=A0A9P7FMK5_9AGAM|nr:uncharacterized protein F5147DRAFT_662795 [Suillus discolor]KAG2120661.1 hypothetical protein F5147DRAFT_662795 [Suillus discolor]
MSESYNRLPFPTSSEEFALPSTSSVASSTSADDGLPNPLFLRLRRPTLLNKSPYYSDKRIQSPLAISFTVASRRRGSNGEESESDRERMWSESSPSSSSGNPTPPITLPLEGDDESNASTRSGGPSPSTPPPSRNLSTNGLPANAGDTSIPILRRPTYPLKPARILNLLAEPRPEEDELQSEAAFQRLLASHSDLPSQPRTPRAPSDRGRYPEEVGHEDSHEDPLSDDDDDDVQGLFAFDIQNETNNVKPCTPAQSVNGDDLNMSLAESPMGVAMDVDPPMVSPSIISTPMSIQWRYTPPPTTSAVRSNKRKLDDRYDPYPTSAKRRAVSPSISYLRETHPSLVSYPRTPSSRPPVPIPLSIPPSNSSTSATSSPTVTSGYAFQAYPGSRQVNLGTMSLSSSPVLRPSLGLVSPILRPILRTRRGADGEEREIEGAGEAVNGLSLS